MKDVWSCVLVEYGGQYLPMDGHDRIPWLCVGNLVTNLKV